ncbi:MAG: MFS transporter [Thermoanaerobaculia bacterium]
MRLRPLDAAVDRRARDPGSGRRGTGSRLARRRLRLYSLEERARVQGLFSGVWGFAALIGPLLGALLTVHLGWRTIFSINIPLGAVAFFLVATRLIESRALLPEPVDLAGAATLALGITLLLFAVLQTPGPAGATRLRELGGEPPLTDLITWYWKGKPAAPWA